MRTYLSLLFISLASFASAQISTNGLIDYFDADHGVTDSVGDGTGFIRSWTNQGPSNSTASSSGNEATLVLGKNGQNFIRFTNSNTNSGINFAQTGALALGFSVVAVLHIDDQIGGVNSSTQNILSDTDTPQALQIVDLFGGDRFQNLSSIDNSSQSSYTDDSVSTHFQSGDTFILTARFTPTSHKIYADGHLVLDKTFTGTGLDFTGDSIWEMGAALNADIGSLLVYDSTTTLADLDQTGLELAKEYDLFYGRRVYVDDSATWGNNDGTSWWDAYTSLDDAINNTPAPAQIWIAKGAYHPTDKTNGFALKSGHSLIGGFDPDYWFEGYTAVSQRDVQENKTVLSGTPIWEPNDGYDFVVKQPLKPSRGWGIGEQGGEDPLYGNPDYDSTTIITCDRADETAKLSGVWLSGSYHNPYYGYSNAAAFLNLGGSPVISDCSFIGNVGHAIANYPYVDQGVWPYELSEGTMTLRNCLIAGNFNIEYGGAVTNAAVLYATNCSFVGNATGLPTYPPTNLYYYSNKGGALGNGGDAYLTNCTFTGNFAMEGGGAIVHHAEFQREIEPGVFKDNKLVIQNSIIWNNGIGETIDDFSLKSISTSRPDLVTITNSIVEHSGGSQAWNSSLGREGGNNIDTDPLFFDEFSPSKAPYYFTHPQIQSNSPAIGNGDASLSIGTSGLFVSDLETDLYGNPRITDRNLDTIARIDMGAYEVLPPLHVSKNGGNWNSGLSWQSPYDMDTAREQGKKGQEIWLVEGTHYTYSSPSYPLKVLGGFPTSARSLDDRDPVLYPSVFNSNYHFSYPSEINLLDGVSIIHEHLICSGSGLVKDCTIQGGFGVTFTENSDAVLLRCKITGSTESGVKVVSQNADVNATLIDCLIAGNSSYGPGGGIKVTNGGLVAIHCTITGNLGDCSSVGGSGGSGIHLVDDAAGINLYSCIVWGNYDGVSIANPEVTSASMYATLEYYESLIGNLVHPDSTLREYDNSNPADIYSHNSVFAAPFDMTNAPIANFDASLASDSIALTENAPSQDANFLPEFSHPSYPYSDSVVDLVYFPKHKANYYYDGSNPGIQSDLGALQYQDPFKIDDDLDGLSNAFEMQFTGGSTTELDATADTDGDGLSTLVEYALGSDPTSSSSNPMQQHDFTNLSGHDYSTLTISRNPTASELVDIYIERSTDLGVNDSWEADETIETSVQDISELLEHATYRSRYRASSSTSEFFRIRVEKK